MLKRRRTARSRREQAHASPVALAIAREKMRRHMVTFGIEIFLTDDGAPAAELLAHLGWVLAIGAEIAALVAPGTADAKRLHAALRTVIQLSTQGGRWQAALAGVLQLAADQANGLMVAHPMQGVDLIDAADYIASRIRAGTATLADVAGHEIYAAAAAPEVQHA